MEHRKSLSCIAFLVVFLAAVFYPAVFQDKLIAPLDIAETLFAPWKSEAKGKTPHNHYTVDAVTQYLTYHSMAEKSLKEDGYIGWNPYEMGGTSLAGNTMALPASWHMQLHRFLSFKNAWNYGIIIEFFIAGLGMFVFLRSRNIVHLLALLGAVAYMMNSQFIFWIHHRWALSSFCWMPWVLWAGIGFEGKEDFTIRRLSLPLFLCMAILGATLQHMVFIVMVCGCMMCGSFKTWWKPEWKKVLFWGGALALAFGIAAFTVIPQVQAYLDNIAIGHKRGGLGYEEGHSQVLFNLLAIPLQIWPWIMGDVSSLDGWRLLKFNYMDLAFMGSIPMLISFIAVWKRNMPKEAKWLIVFGLLIPLTPLVGPLYHRIQLLFILGGAWLAAEFLNSLYLQKNFLNTKRLILAGLFVGQLLLVLSLMPYDDRHDLTQKVVAKAVEHGRESVLANDPEWIAKRASLWVERLGLHNPRSLMLYGFFLLGCGALRYVGGNHTHAKKRNAMIILASITAAESVVLLHSWVTFSHANDYPLTHHSLTELKTHVGDDRVYQGLNKLALPEVYMPANMLTTHQVRIVEGYESIHHDNPMLKFQDNFSDALKYSGVKWQILPALYRKGEDNKNWEQVAEYSGYVLLKNNQALAPLLSGQSQIPNSFAELEHATKDAKTIKIIRRTMNSLEFIIPNETKWIRFEENADKGWQWRINHGAWQHVQKGIDACIWLPVKGLTGNVEMKFIPHNFLVLCISCLSAALYSLFLICGIRIHKSKFLTN